MQFTSPPGQAQENKDEETTADDPEEELPPPTPEELKQLRADAAKAGEYYERLLRQVAETDNLRKRLAKDQLRFGSPRRYTAASSGCA